MLMYLISNPVVCDVRVAGSCCNIEDNGVNWFISPLLPHLPTQHRNTAAVAHCANCHYIRSLRKQPVFGLTISYCQYGEMCQGMPRNCCELTEQSLPNVDKPPLELQWEMKAYSDTKR